MGRSKWTTSPQDYAAPPTTGENIEKEQGKSKKSLLSNKVLVGSVSVLVIGALVSEIGVTPEVPIDQTISSPSSASVPYEPSSSGDLLLENEDAESPSTQSSNTSTSLPEEQIASSSGGSSLDHSESSEEMSTEIESSTASSGLEYIAPPTSESIPEAIPEPEPESESMPEVISEPEPESESMPEAIPEPESESVPGAIPEPESESESVPEVIPEPKPKPEPEVIPEPEPEPEIPAENEPVQIHGFDANTTVYVSERSNTIHSYSNCSGMKNFRTMTLGAADARGYKYCKKCW